MLIYAGTKSDFMIDTENDRLETKLYENIKLKMNRTTGLSELNAWRNSLKEMYITLNDSDIPKDSPDFKTGRFSYFRLWIGWKRKCCYC